MIGIYKITSPTGKVYIGQSVNIERRFYSYSILHNCKSQIILYRSFVKYDIKNHTFDIIEECEELNLNNRERYYQDLFNVTGINGLNCMLTNSDDKSGKMSLQSRKKLSESRKNLSEQSRKNISIGQINKCKTVNKKQGLTLSKNESNNLRLKNNNESKKIKIGVFDYNTDEKISEFESIRECSRVMNVDRKSVSESCKNIRPYAYGFKFKFI